MRAAGGGTIVNVSSVAGKRGWANAAAYCASKFGLTGLTQALAAEGRPDGIRACVLYPGAMATSGGVWSPTARKEAQRERPPARTALPPGEVAALIGPRPAKSSPPTKTTTAPPSSSPPPPTAIPCVD